MGNNFDNEVMKCNSLCRYGFCWQSRGGGMGMKQMNWQEAPGMCAVCAHYTPLGAVMLHTNRAYLKRACGGKG